MEVRKGYKWTEVGEIPREWQVVPLKDVSERIMVGIASAATHAYRPTGVPLLRNQNIKPGFLDDGDILYVAPEYEQTFRSKRLKAGDLLTARTGYPGMTCVVPARYEGAQSFTTLITRPRAAVLDSSFVNQFVNSAIGQAFFVQSQIGGAQKNVNVAALRLMPVPVPPLSEQRAIAAALADIDDLLTALDQLIARQRDLKQSAMQALLTGKRRLPGHSGRWETRRLQEITRLEMGRTPSRQVASFWGSGHPWLSIGDLQGRVICETKEEITERAARQMSMIPRGTLVMSFKLSIGRVAFTGRDMYSNEAICSFNDLKASAEFLYYVLPRTDFSLYGKQAVKGFTLNKESLNSVVVPYPPVPEQRAIAAVLSDMDAEIEALEARREKTRLLKQGMMQELLTGRTRLV